MNILVKTGLVAGVLLSATVATCSIKNIYQSSNNTETNNVAQVVTEQPDVAMSESGGASTENVSVKSNKANQKTSGKKDDKSETVAETEKKSSNALVGVGIAALVGAIMLSGSNSDADDQGISCAYSTTSCGYGYIATGNTCVANDTTYVECVVDDSNFVEIGGTVYPKVNCQNGGTQTSATCTCPEGWTGDLCDTAVTCGAGFTQTTCGTGYNQTGTCKSGNTTYVSCTFDDNNFIDIGGTIYPKVNCQNGGTQTSATCSCLEGWTGDLCETAVDCGAGFAQTNCGTGYIQNGTCKSGNTTYVTCTFDDNNFIDIGGTIYPKVNCQNGGTQTSATCTCLEGWTGDLCETAVDCGAGFAQTNCGTGYIQNGTCKSGNTTYVSCAFDDNNFIDIGGTVYPKVNCQNGGTQTGANCSCLDGWTGDTCVTAVNCGANFTQTSCTTGYNQTGTCKSGNTTYVSCALDTDNFIEIGGTVYPKVNCQNGGTQTSATCSCLEGWTGDLCDTAVNCGANFTQTSCATGYNQTGTCKSGNTTYVSCTFDDNNFIDIGGTVYPKVNCQNGGTQTSATCTCPEGWTGDLCDTAVTCGAGFTQTTCGTGYNQTGTCKSGNTTYVSCELIALSCVHGTQNGTQCSCETGWIGNLCDTFDSENYIDQGGTVYPKLNCGVHSYQDAASCVCVLGYTNYVEGIGCSIPTDENSVIINSTNNSDVYGIKYANVSGGAMESGNRTILIDKRGGGNVYGIYSSGRLMRMVNLLNGTTGETSIINIDRDGTGNVYGLYSEGVVNSWGSADGAVAVIQITNYGDAGEIVGLSSNRSDYLGYAYNLYNPSKTNSGDAIIRIVQNGTGAVYGMKAAGGDVNNVGSGGRGVISIVNNGPSNAYGMYGEEAHNVKVSDAGNYDITASGNINITNLGGGVAYGMYGVRLFNEPMLVVRKHNKTNVVQKGDSGIMVQNISGKAYGMYVKDKGYVQYVCNGYNGCGTNTGGIWINNIGTGIVKGVFGENNTVVNNGAPIEITRNSYIDGDLVYTPSDSVSNDVFGIQVGDHSTVKTTGSAAYIDIKSNGSAYGVYAGNSSTVTNGTSSAKCSINVNVQGDGYGIYVETDSDVYNYGNINVMSTNGNAFGIYAKSGSTVTNSGKIAVTTNGNAYGIYAEGNSTVTNTGTITINGTSCTGSNCGAANNAIVLNGSTLYNSGAMQANTLSLNSMGGNIVAQSGSSFVVDNAMSGDLHISNDIVTSGNQTTYIAENMIDAGDTSGLNLVSDSAMFDVSLNGKDVVMQMKDFEELTDNKSLAAFLKDNYDAGNGEEMFAALKSMDNISAFNGALAGMTGLSAFTQFAHEDMSAMREISFSMNNKLFENSDKESFDISDSMGYFSFSDRHNGGSGQYGISSDKINDKWKLGYGMAMANINTNDDNGMYRQNKMWLFYVPATYRGDDIELVISPKAGFSRSEYSRRGYKNMNYEGYIEKRIFGLMNDVRYPLMVGNWTLAPDVSFNAIVYSQEGQEEAHEYSLIIPHDNIVSLETGLGLYSKYEKILSDGGRIKFTTGIMAYREFGDTYNIKLGMRGMDGTFDLYNNSYEYRGAMNMGVDYTTGRFHMYGNMQYFMDNANYMNFKAGVSYRF